MKVIEHVDKLRFLAKSVGDYVRMSEVAGVSESWLAKFAQGKISNPTVDSINKLEKVYIEQNNDTTN